MRIILGTILNWFLVFHACVQYPQPCSSRQADDMLGFLTQATKTSGSDSLKILAQIRSDARKKRGSNLFKRSREGRPNPIPPCGSEEGGYVFTEEMLKLNPFAKNFAAGPEDSSKKSSPLLFYDMQKKHFDEITGSL